MVEKKAVIPITDEERAVINQAYQDMFASIKSDMDDEDKRHIRMPMNLRLRLTANNAENPANLTSSTPLP
jgi:hypothetical protein